MNYRELYKIATENISKLEYKYKYQSGADLPYAAENLNSLRFALDELSAVPSLKSKIEGMKKGPLFSSYGDKLRFDHADSSKISSSVEELKVGLRFFMDFFEVTMLQTDEHQLSIRLPDLKTFGDLESVAKEFKLSIEIPILDARIEGEVDIRSAEPGSIWLTIGVGTAAAVKLIAGITWAAAVCRKKRAEAKIFEEHAKTLELKNDQLTMLMSAQKEQLNRVLASEAEAIIAKHYSHEDPETIERLKLSINSISELIDKGTKILPVQSSDEIRKLFPEYDKLDLIESTIKKLKEE